VRGHRSPFSEHGCSADSRSHSAGGLTVRTARPRLFEGGCSRPHHIAFLTYCALASVGIWNMPTARLVALFCQNRSRSLLSSRRHEPTSETFGGGIRAEWFCRARAMNGIVPAAFGTGGTALLRRPSVCPTHRHPHSSPLDGGSPARSCHDVVAKWRRPGPPTNLGHSRTAWRVCRNLASRIPNRAGLLQSPSGGIMGW